VTAIATNPGDRGLLRRGETVFILTGDPDHPDATLLFKGVIKL
jgi:hypothetical protein